MLSTSAREATNRLLAIHCRSFAQYLAFAKPYAPEASQKKLDLFEQIVADQSQIADRIVAFLVDAEVPPETGKFPMEFTDVHDLSIDYLLKEALRHQRRDVADIGACVEALKASPAARALAEEALGMAKAHLHLLEEICSESEGIVAATSVA
jgi:hypothetical protein